jgi:hypothetical protein
MYSIADVVEKRQRQYQPQYQYLYGLKDGQTSALSRADIYIFIINKNRYESILDLLHRNLSYIYGCQYHIYAWLGEKQKIM